MKKWTTILLLALLAALCLAVSCKNDPPPHEHEFDLTAWEHDEDSHWRKAVCEHTDEVKDKAAHTWDDGTVSNNVSSATSSEVSSTVKSSMKSKVSCFLRLFKVSFDMVD